MNVLFILCNLKVPRVCNGWRAVKIFDKEPGSLLPEAYVKFWREWKLATPTAVHHIPKESKWERNEITGEVYVYFFIKCMRVSLPILIYIFVVFLFKIYQFQ